MWTMLIPVLIIAGSNTFYNICTKSTPENVNTFCSLFVIYVVAAVTSAILFLVTAGKGNIQAEFAKLNWTSVVLGFILIGLEGGYILLFRAGWKISVGSLVCNIILAVVLLFVGVFLFKEKVSVRQLIGIVVCAAGLILVTG